MSNDSFFRSLNRLYHHFGSWRAVSRNTGIHRETIRRWWKGKREPRPESIAEVKELARIYTRKAA